MNAPTAQLKPSRLIKTRGSKRRGATTGKRSAKAKSPAVPAWLWAVFGLSLGILLTALFFLKQQEQRLGKVEQQSAPVTTPKLDKYPAIKLEEPADNLSFREILDNKSIEVEVKALASKGTFIMQCGSFKSLSSADALKAELALLGLEATIKQSEWENAIWYRVLLGPYSSKRAAENDRHMLQNQNINRCKIW